MIFIEPAILMMVIMEVTAYTVAASYSLTAERLVRNARAMPGGSRGRFDSQSKMGRYWINSITQGSHKGPNFSAYGGRNGKRIFFEDPFPRYSTNNDEKYKFG